jgi:predicted acylesterase/phospholipase RssA
VRIGPPRDAPIVEALTAALSTLLSTEPAWVRDRQGSGRWLRDARPAIVDAGAIVADLEATDPRPIIRTRPHAPVRAWRLNWITSSFIMHSSNERNQTLLAAHYLDLLARHRALERRFAALGRSPLVVETPSVGHVDLPYVGSTEAFTNMRQSAQNKDTLMARFRALLDGQLDSFDFRREANVIYGAGGFSGILAGLVTTRSVDDGFARAGGHVRQVYGVSAGVLNGFFHAIQLAAVRRPDLYRPAARQALGDLEAFVGSVEPKRVAAINLNPVRFWKGWANLGPMEAFFIDRLRAYTGNRSPESLTFDDLDLPLTVAAARGDGYTDFLGPSLPHRRMSFGGKDWSPVNTPVVRALLAGWSMNTYISPTALNGQEYRDGGSTFYDPALFVACMDEIPVNLLNIHLDEPEGHSYNLPDRPNLLRILFDTHNYIFPEERRRMRRLTDLLFEHLRLLRTMSDATGETAEDFRQDWVLSREAAGEQLPEALYLGQG